MYVSYFGDLGLFIFFPLAIVLSRFSIMIPLLLHIYVQTYLLTNEFPTEYAWLIMPLTFLCFRCIWPQKKVPNYVRHICEFKSGAWWDVLDITCWIKLVATCLCFFPEVPISSPTSTLCNKINDKHYNQ